MNKIQSIGEIAIASRLSEPERTQKLQELFAKFLKARSVDYCTRTARLLGRSFSPNEVASLTSK